MAMSAISTMSSTSKSLSSAMATTCPSYSMVRSESYTTEAYSARSSRSISFSTATSANSTISSSSISEESASST
jgi:hypothetical protein